MLIPIKVEVATRICRMYSWGGAYPYHLKVNVAVHISSIRIYIYIYIQGGGAPSYLIRGGHPYPLYT